MTWRWCWLWEITNNFRGYGDDTAVRQHQHKVDLVPALLKHEYVRLVRDIVNIADAVAEKINNLYNICTWCPSGWHVAAKISANEFIVERFRLHLRVSAVGLTQAFMPWSKVSPRNLSTSTRVFEITAWMRVLLVYTDRPQQVPTGTASQQNTVLSYPLLNQQELPKVLPSVRTAMNQENLSKTRYVNINQTNLTQWGTNRNNYLKDMST